MEELLGNIYSLLDSLYGKPLSEYLWGYNCESQDYSGDLIYNQIGIVAIIFAVVLFERISISFELRLNTFEISVKR